MLRSILAASLLLTGTALAQDNDMMEDPEAGLGDEDFADDDFGDQELGYEDLGEDPVYEDEVEQKALSAGVLVGVGVQLDDLLPSPWGLGLGVNAGYNLDAIYIGFQFVYFVGGSETLLGTQVSGNIITVGAEVGYDIAVAGLILRPGLGLGLALVSLEVANPNPLGVGAAAVDVGNEEIYIAPGAVVLYDVIDGAFVGLDLRLPILIGDSSATALTFIGYAGLRF